MADNGQSPDSISLTIDGHEVTVPKGTTILQAAQGMGTEVPHYCYHPGLSSPAMCRLCLVEVDGVLGRAALALPGAFQLGRKSDVTKVRADEFAITAWGHARAATFEVMVRQAKG